MKILQLILIGLILSGMVYGQDNRFTQLFKDADKFPQEKEDIWANLDPETERAIDSLLKENLRLIDEMIEDARSYHSLTDEQKKVCVDSIIIYISLFYEQDTISLESATEEDLIWILENIPGVEAQVVMNLAFKKAYLDYCYADSVKREGYRFIQTGEFGRAISGYDEWQTWKVPHEYPTFERYVRWLEKLLKE